jgi:hypothetical protein
MSIPVEENIKYLSPTWADGSPMPNAKRHTFTVKNPQCVQCRRHFKDPDVFAARYSSQPPTVCSEKCRDEMKANGLQAEIVRGNPFDIDYKYSVPF